MKLSGLILPSAIKNVALQVVVCISRLQPFLRRRYLAVCHPFFVHQGQGPPGAGGGSGAAARAFKRRTWRYLMPALLFAVAINVPKFLEFQNYVNIGAGNRTFIRPTELRMDPDYVVRSSTLALCTFLVQISLYEVVSISPPG